MVTTQEPALRLHDLFADGRLPAACPTRTVLDHVTSTWGLLLLLALADGPLRWGELRRAVEGISEKMLAQTLRTLVADHLVHREVGETVPPRVDYSLTGLGEELVAHLLPLMRWIQRNADEILAPTPAP